jgi:hypothetical protein
MNKLEWINPDKKLCNLVGNLYNIEGFIEKLSPEENKNFMSLVEECMRRISTHHESQYARCLCDSCNKPTIFYGTHFYENQTVPFNHCMKCFLAIHDIICGHFTATVSIFNTSYCAHKFVKTLKSGKWPLSMQGMR